MTYQQNLILLCEKLNLTRSTKSNDRYHSDIFVVLGDKIILGSGDNSSSSYFTEFVFDSKGAILSHCTGE